MCAEGIADYCWMIGVDGLAGRHDVRCSHRNGACHAVHHVHMARQAAPVELMVRGDRWRCCRCLLAPSSRINPMVFIATLVISFYFCGTRR